MTLTPWNTEKHILMSIVAEKFSKSSRPFWAKAVNSLGMGWTFVNIDNGVYEKPHITNLNNRWIENEIFSSRAWCKAGVLTLVVCNKYNAKVLTRQGTEERNPGWQGRSGHFYRQTTWSYI